MPNSVAAALDIPDQPNRPMTETLANYLRTRNVLLLIDGCEHLPAACQNLIDHLLRTSTTVRILATSRQTLGIEGELRYRVPSVRLPDVGRPPAVNRSVPLGQPGSISLGYTPMSSLGPPTRAPRMAVVGTPQIATRVGREGEPRVGRGQQIAR